MSITAASHYDTLCVSADATDEEIKAAYRRLIRAYHPDIAGAMGEAMTQRINAAYSDLSNPAKRSSYDFSIRPQQAPAAAPAPTPAATPTAAPRTQPTRSPNAPKLPTREEMAAREAQIAADFLQEQPEVVSYDASSHRKWAITWAILGALLIAAYAIIVVEQVRPSVPLNVWRFIPALLVPTSMFAYFSNVDRRVYSGLFMWFGATILPLGALLNVWVISWISDGLSLSVMIAMTALPFLTYGANWSRKVARAHRILKKARA